MSTTILGGRYRITEKIGTGGMADVYKAIDETLGRTVAVKVMHSKYASDESFTQRFRQEAQAAANLQSPNIVNIYDWGSEGEYYYIVMEYVRGTDLKTIIRQKGALTSKQVAEIGAQVCNALSVAHGYDIIHRDIKPHNIMVTPDGMVKVMDFGIARAGNTTMTQTGSVLGTAHYVSPEQAQGRALTNASDLYSLGVVLYEAATGRLPFDGDTPVAVALKQVNEQPQRPSLYAKDIDPRLEDIIGRSMSKDPRKRYSTAEEMRKDLLRIVEGVSPLDKTTVLPGVVGGIVGANDATTVLPGVDPGTGTTVMPAVGVQGAAYGGGAEYAHIDLDGQHKKSRKGRIARLIAALLALLVLGGLLAYAISQFDPSIGGIEVPDVTNKTVVEATGILTEAGLEVGTVTEKFDPKIEKGLIISQDPPAGERVVKEVPEDAEEGTEEVYPPINLIVSKGVEMGVVPEIVGMSEADARAALKEAGFDADPQPAQNSSTVPAGKVISQDPAPGTELEKGKKVKFVPSRGAEIVAVPDVTGNDTATAEGILANAGFFMEVTDDYSDSVAEGLIISQNPGPGIKTEKGSTVTVVRSLGKKIVPISVPNVVGVRADTAQTLLQNAGLTSTLDYKKTNNTGNVVSQNPTGGTSVNPGTSVTLTVDADAP